MERNKYINTAIQHLQDGSTYKQLTKEEAEQQQDFLQSKMNEIMDKHANNLSKLDRKYLERYASQEHSFAQFYITAKIHKKPWKPRPICSTPGSILYSLGKIVDQQLQKITQRLPTTIQSSTHLLEKLKNRTHTTTNKVSFFKADAVSMYTNIETEHALDTITKFLSNPDWTEYTTGTNTDLIIDGLTLIMEHNIMQFDDTYWLQTTGTAMGVPPGAAFATLYYAIWELEGILPYNKQQLAFYGRLIDDMIGLWIHDPNPIIDQENWDAFKVICNSYGSLEWESTQRLPTTIQII